MVTRTIESKKRTCVNRAGCALSVQRRPESRVFVRGLTVLDILRVFLFDVHKITSNDPSRVLST